MKPKQVNPPVPDWQVELIGLDDEHFVARVTAALMRSGASEQAGSVLGAVGDSPRIARLYAEALEGKRWKCGLTPTGLAIVKAWYAAACAHGAKSDDGCFNMDGGSQTLRDVKTEYATRFAKQSGPEIGQTHAEWLLVLQKRKKIPHDFTFRKTLTRCELPYREDKRGAPRK